MKGPRPVAPATTPARHYVMWMFTGACPSRCTYCDIASQQHKRGLSAAEAQRVAREILALGFSEVMFAGGEPLLSPSLPGVLEILRGRVRTAVFSGGLPGLADRAAAIVRDGGVDRLVFSLDSGDPAVNDRIRGRAGITEALLAQVAAAVAASPEVDRSVNTVVSRFNVDELGSVWDRMRGFGLDSWSLTVAGDFFEGQPAHAFLSPEALWTFYTETVPALAERLAADGAELVVLPVPLPLLEAQVPPARWGEVAREKRPALVEALGEFAQGAYNRAFVTRHGCPLVGIDVVLGIDGAVHPCSQPPIIHPDHVIGNVRTTPLAEILAGPALRAFAEGVPHAPCSRCWAPSNIPRDLLARMLSGGAPARRPG